MAKGEVMLGKVDHGVPLEYSTEEGVLKIFGFWVFLASDLILFATLFALYSILYTHTNGGPGPADLYEVRGFTAETFILLTSSFTCGLATHQMRLGDAKWMNIWLVVTLLLGLSFIALEVSEFITYVARGATIQKSAFLSSFFVLVGTHGCHVSLGIVWMLCIMIQAARRGITAVTARKVFIVGLYWHFLDVVWVFIFSAVYLPGVM
nr:cytochrome aa3 quinol oxidase subunit III [Aneurinibacillus tyrosinisolvens]